MAFYYFSWFNADMTMPITPHELSPGELLFRDLEHRFADDIGVISVLTEEPEVTGVLISSALHLDGDQPWSGIGVTIGDLSIHVGQAGDIHIVTSAISGERRPLIDGSEEIICSLVRRIITL